MASWRSPGGGPPSFESSVAATSKSPANRRFPAPARLRGSVSSGCWWSQSKQRRRRSQMSQEARRRGRASGPACVVCLAWRSCGKLTGPSAGRGCLFRLRRAVMGPPCRLPSSVYPAHSSVAERGAAWLAHLSGGQGVAGSNPAAPTMFYVSASGRSSNGRTAGFGPVNVGSSPARPARSARFRRRRSLIYRGFTSRTRRRMLSG